MKVGYARVSSSDQDLSLQIEQLKKEGCKRIFSEKKSGSNIKERLQLQYMLDFVRDGDIVVVTKTDRIARNTIHALELADNLKEKNVGFILMDLAGADINSDVGRFIYTVMSTFAEMERKRIRQRQREGIDRAKANGKVFGRKSILTDQMLTDIKRVLKKTGSARDTAARLNISKNTVYKAQRILNDR